MKWRSMKDAPRDGSSFAAWCVETGKTGYDVARWADDLKRFQTKYGWHPIAWVPLPDPPTADERAELMQGLT